MPKYYPRLQALQLLRPVGRAPRGLRIGHEFAVDDVLRRPIHPISESYLVLGVGGLDGALPVVQVRQEGLLREGVVD